MRRPSFQFYHGDWRSNAKLRRCSLAQRGIWLEVMCLMADSDEFGILRWPLADIANAVPCRIVELRTLIERDVMKGADQASPCEPFIFTPRHAGRDGNPVVLITEQSGPIWYSSRMVRDAYIASTRGKGTRFGDAPNSPPNSTPIHRLGDGPSSSSSSASSSSTAFLSDASESFIKKPLEKSSGKERAAAQNPAWLFNFGHAQLHARSLGINTAGKTHQQLKDAITAAIGSADASTQAPKFA